MVNWMKEHIYFLERIGSYLLNVKGLDINEYIELMTNAGTAIRQNCCGYNSSYISCTHQCFDGMDGTGHPKEIMH